MGHVSRAGAALAAALVAGAFAAACGGSVADSDRRQPVRTEPAPTDPFCVAAQANVDAIRPLNSLLATRGGAPPEELSNTIDAVRRAGDAMLTAAPAEIRADVERTVQAVDLQLDALLASGGDAAAVTDDPALTDRLSSPEFAGAGERVRSYVDSNCGTGDAAGR
jgi:hypothetical protein